MAGYRTFSGTQDHLDSQLSVLSGWKDIANYLRRGVRTVQRYERELRLPVRRPAGKPRASVMILRCELEEWLSASRTSHGRAQLNPQCVLELKSAVFTLRRLCAEAHDLRAALSAQRTALELNIGRIGQAVSQPVVLEAERHRAVAAQQKARAIEMRVTARDMVNRAIEMRNSPQQSLTINC